jgi:dTDP-4-amino-4,6-dideoxygalactose transaminase
MIKIPLFKVYMNPYVDDELLKTVHSGYIGQGSKVEEFENKIKERINNPFFLSLSAGTHGLHLALRDIGIGLGDEVISTPLTCTATNWPILMQQGVIVWSDIQKDTLNIDPKSIEKRINEKTKAVIAVDWGGGVCDYDEIKKITHPYKIPIIQDSAHAFGASYKGNPIGSCINADYTMFSFQAIKTLNMGGDGGGLCLNNINSYKAVKLARWYGISREGLKRDMRCEEAIDTWGLKYNPNDISATIGLKNLEEIDRLLNIGKDNASYYMKELNNIDGIKLLRCNEGSTFWIFTILVEDRTSFASMMGEYGIHISRVHERNDIHPCVTKFKRDDLENLEWIISRYCAIPVSWYVSQEDREYIVQCIKRGW